MPTQSRAPVAAASLPVLEMNETETTRPTTEGAVNSTGPKVCYFVIKSLCGCNFILLEIFMLMLMY